VKALEGRVDLWRYVTGIESFVDGGTAQI